MKSVFVIPVHSDMFDRFHRLRTAGRARVLAWLHEVRQGLDLGLDTPASAEQGALPDHVTRVMTACTDDEALTTLLISFVGSMTREDFDDRS